MAYQSRSRAILSDYFGDKLLLQALLKKLQLVVDLLLLFSMHGIRIEAVYLNVWYTKSASSFRLQRSLSNLQSTPCEVENHLPLETTTCVATLS